MPPKSATNSLRFSLGRNAKNPIEKWYDSYIKTATSNKITTKKSPTISSVCRCLLLKVQWVIVVAQIILIQLALLVFVFLLMSLLL